MTRITSIALLLGLLMSSLMASAQIDFRERNGLLEYSYRKGPFKPLAAPASTTVVSSTVTAVPSFSSLVGVPGYLSAASLNAKLESSTYFINRQADQAVVAALKAVVDGHVANGNNPHNTTKAQVGLDKVPNVDATNPVNINQSSTFRFTTDAEKAGWNQYGTDAFIRGKFSSSGDLDYETLAGKFHLKANQVNLIVASFLTSREGFAPGRVLMGTAEGGFSWGVVTGGNSTTAPSTTPGPSPSNVPADSTINRPNYALLTDVPLTSVSELAVFLTSPQTNKRGLLAKGIYDIGAGTLGQTANWNNVVLTAPLGATITGTSSNLLLFTDNHQVNRVKIDNLTLTSTATGTGYSVILSNELVGFKGLEFSFLKVSGPMSANFNTFNITQYSTSSNSGATSSDLYVHDCQFSAPRIEMEILSQGYDVVRLSNVTITRNKFYKTAPNPNEPHRQACSFSGLISGVYMADNTSTGAKDIAWELVNVRYVLAENNVASTNELCSGWSITDDGRNSTESIYIRGGSVDVQGRPLVVYQAKGVHLDGVKLKGGRGIDCNLALNGVYENLDVLIQSTDFEAAWQFDSGCTGNVLKNSTISSWGSAAAGRNPSFESIVLRGAGTNGRAATANNTLTNLVIKQGKKADGTYFTNGVPVNQGASTNTVDAATSNNVQLEP